jgi:hypothetical protein
MENKPKKEYLIGVDSLVRVEASSEEEAIRIGSEKFYEAFTNDHYLEFTIESVNDIKE